MTRGGRNGGHQKGLYSWLESTSTVLPEGTAEQSRACMKHGAQPTRNQLGRSKRGKRQPESLQSGVAGVLTGRVSAAARCTTCTPARCRCELRAGRPLTARGHHPWVDT